MVADGKRVALVAGATGAVGSRLIPALAEDPSVAQIIALSRRPLDRAHSKLDVRLIDFEALAALPPIACDEVHCCLGTTRKQAGSKAAFRRVDAEYVAALGRFGRRSGARQFLLVSAVGTSAASPSFYSRVKAEAEAALGALGYPSLQIFRPSILLAERAEARPGEAAAIAVARKVGPVLRKGLSRYRGIEPEQVARAMAAAARGGRPGVHVHHYEEMRRLAEQP